MDSIQQEQRQCNRCKEVKSVVRYSKNTKRSDGLQIWCKDCQRVTRAQWSRDNPERTKELRLLSKYKLTTEQINQRLEQQNELCSLCPTKLSYNTFHVDHRHACCSKDTTCGGCVRSLLCGPCNQALGWFEKFKSCPELMIKFESYLEKFSGAQSINGDALGSYPREEGSLPSEPT